MNHFSQEVKKSDLFQLTFLHVFNCIWVQNPMQSTLTICCCGLYRKPTDLSKYPKKGKVFEEYKKCLYVRAYEPYHHKRAIIHPEYETKMIYHIHWVQQ